MIDLHFHPQNNVTFSFANLLRNYDASREQSFLIVGTNENGHSLRPRVLFSVCREYVRAFVFIRRTARLIARIHPEVEPALTKHVHGTTRQTKDVLRITLKSQSLSFLYIIIILYICICISLRQNVHDLCRPIHTYMLF